MLANAIREELPQFLQDNSSRLTDDGQPAIVRNGYHAQPSSSPRLATWRCRSPNCADPIDQQAVFRSALVPPYVRRSQTLVVVLAWLYLYGVSTGQMAEALSALVGEQQYRNLSPAVLSCRKKDWEKQ